MNTSKPNQATFRVNMKNTTSGEGQAQCHTWCNYAMFGSITCTRTGHPSMAQVLNLNLEDASFCLQNSTHRRTYVGIPRFTYAILDSHLSFLLFHLYWVLLQLPIQTNVHQQAFRVHLWHVVHYQSPTELQPRAHVPPRSHTSAVSPNTTRFLGFRPDSHLLCQLVWISAAAPMTWWHRVPLEGICKTRHCCYLCLWLLMLAQNGAADIGHPKIWLVQSHVIASAFAHICRHCQPLCMQAGPCSPPATSKSCRQTMTLLG